MIELRGVSKTVESGGRPLTILHPLDVAIPSGRFLAVVGPSGSGKSTLLGLLAGLDAPSTGEILIDGIDITKLSEDALARLRRSDAERRELLGHRSGTDAELEAASGCVVDRDGAQEKLRRTNRHSHLANVVAEAKSPLRKPRHRIDKVGAVEQNRKMTVRTGGLAAVADRRDLVTCHHPLARAHQPGVHRMVQGTGHRAAFHSAGQA